MLTDIGEKFGGEYVQHPKYGTFIVWPEQLLVDEALSQGQKLTATQLGELFGLHAKKVNQLLNELGWINRENDGWHITALGLKAGGEQREDKLSETLFAVWHDTVTKNKSFRNSVSEFLGADSDNHSTDKSFSSFRQKFAAKHRTADGHYVRSKGEMMIDNWLYMAGIVHAYERKLPIEEEVFSDFYLPGGKVYIQYWGSDTGTIPARQKTEKLSLYQKHGLNLIEIEEQDIYNLDNILPAKLRKFGITAY